MSLILTVEHAYAAGIRELKTIGKFIEAEALPVMESVGAKMPTVEAITGLMCPQLVNIERTAEAVLAKCIVAIEDAEKAAASGLVNVALDAALIADIKSIMPAVKASAPNVPPPTA